MSLYSFHRGLFVWKCIAIFFYGAITGIAVAFPEVWFLSLGSLIPLLIFIEKTRESAHSVKRNLFFGGFIFGLGLVGAVTLWMFDALPLTWIGLPQSFFGTALVSSTWAVNTLLLSCVIGLSVLTVGTFSPRKPLSFITYPAIWVSFEMGRALWFSIYASGPVLSFGTDFSFGFLGYALSASKLLWVARLGGVWALSALVILANLFLYQVLFSKQTFKIKTAVICCGFLCVLLLQVFLPSAAVVTKDPEVVIVSNLRVVPVRTDFRLPIEGVAQAERVRRERELLRLVIGAMSMKPAPDVILLPENRAFIQNLYMLSSAERSTFYQMASSSKVLIIDSSTKVGFYGDKEVLNIFDGSLGHSIAEGDKSFVVPFGEYFPVVYELVLPVIGMGTKADTYIRNFRYSRGAIPGELPLLLIERNGVVLAPLLCSDAFNPTRYPTMVWQGADVLLNLSSSAWAHNNSARIQKQTIAMALVTSVFTGKPYIQASNNAPSLFIEPMQVSFDLRHDVSSK